MNLNIYFNLYHQKAIKEGIKLHAIIEDELDNYIPGDGLKFRNSLDKIFHKAICFRTQKINISNKSIIVDGRELSSTEMLKLVKNEGYVNKKNFLKKFGSNFKGKIIFWTDLKY